MANGVRARRCSGPRKPPGGGENAGRTCSVRSLRPDGSLRFWWLVTKPRSTKTTGEQHPHIGARHPDRDHSSLGVWCGHDFHVAVDVVTARLVVCDGWFLALA